MLQCTATPKVPAFMSSREYLIDINESGSYERCDSRFAIEVHLTAL